ncbi:MAG TPA: magnesium and cobalt transport protein CorA [Spirochaetaceae bacterium]|jgi:magnesium transporter|nr:magnesium and cobalt transport protein CorA [Spirochaetaceae bacterium]
MSDKKRKKGRRPIEPIFKSVNTGHTGLSVETPVYIGDKVPTEAAFSLIQYDQAQLSFVTPEHIEEVLAMLEEGMVNWINVNGLGDQDAIKRLGGYFKLDPLTVEDILNTEHRPKVEDFGHYLLIITKMLTRRPDDTIEYEQVSFILTRNAVITVQETPGDCFDPVRDRLHAGIGKLRRLGGSYLAYALLDVIVDNYFSLLEWLGDRLEAFEEWSVSSRDSRDFMAGLQAVKSEMNRMRRVVWPVRETANSLLRSDSELLDERLDPYLRDLQENTIQVIEALESYRETASGIREVFLSSLSSRMNEVMKVLTIISTIFIPLTFIAGVYGMNFRSMPELDQRWGYPAVWALMVAIALGMIAFFKRNKWI